MPKAFVVLLVLLSIVCSCTHPRLNKAVVSNRQTAIQSAGISYIADTAQSRLWWTGFKPGGSHTGLLPMAAGSLTVGNNRISGGTFTLNMQALSNTDVSGGSRRKLEEHLRSADFFDVGKYPEASFDITGVQTIGSDSSLVSGNLALKGITKNITFPAAIIIAGDSIVANADFTIDRSQWQVSYKGPNNPLNRVNSKDVSIMLHLVALHR